MRDDLPAAEVHKVLAYDPATGCFRWKVRRSGAARAGWFKGSNKGKGYLNVSLNRRNYGAHRVAWLLHYGEWPEGFIDHIDGDPSNNSIANLRCASRSENGRNRARLAASNKSGVTGVHWSTGSRRWVAKIGVPGEGKRAQIHLGTFRDKGAAIRARRQAEREYFGEFAPAKWEAVVCL